MAHRDPARRATRRVAGPLLVLAAVAAVAGFELLASSTAATPVGAASPAIASRVEVLGAPGEGGGVPPPPKGSAAGEAESAVPSGTTVFDDDVPGVAKLDPALLGALRRAATAAEVDGISFAVDSGWRSAAYQEHLLRKAVAKYGSQREAARWVATPDTSSHVSGDAVDLGPARARTWLSEHGATYGLCQVYRNEPWHFELRPDAPRHGCPRMYADPTHDPMMRQ